MKVLNLYAGIGGNRKLWNGVDVIAVEIDKHIAKAYQDFFPNDDVIINDAHKYLLDYYNDGWDFIWSSPPCPTHSTIGKANTKRKIQYPDMRLYEEILLLQGYSNCKWVVENVVSFYKPLIKPYEVQRHYFWSNFPISDNATIPIEQTCSINDRERLTKLFGFNVDSYSGFDKRKALRNCVHPDLGKHIFDCAFKIVQKPLTCR